MLKISVHWSVYILLLLRTINYLLWDKFSTSRLEDDSKPSGILVNRLWLKSNVVNSVVFSALQKSSWGIPELLIKLWRTINDLNEQSSVSSPNNFSMLLCAIDKCS